MSNQNLAPAVTVTESMSSDMTHTPVQNVTFGLKANAAMTIANSVLNAQPSPMNPNPTCEGDCRFRHQGSSKTLLYYTPVYDKHGNNLNPDGNTTTSGVSCDVCNRSWVTRTRYNETTVEEIKDSCTK